MGANQSTMESGCAPSSWAESALAALCLLFLILLLLGTHGLQQKQDKCDAAAVDERKTTLTLEFWGLLLVTIFFAVFIAVGIYRAVVARGSTTKTSPTRRGEPSEIELGELGRSY